MVEWVTFVRDIPVTVLCLCIGVIFVKRTRGLRLKQK